jgi:hypothetical protein
MAGEYGGCALHLWQYIGVHWSTLEYVAYVGNAYGAEYKCVACVNLPSMALHTVNHSQQGIHTQGIHRHGIHRQDIHSHGKAFTGQIQP